MKKLKPIKLLKKKMETYESFFKKKNIKIDLITKENM